MARVGEASGLPLGRVLGLQFGSSLSEGGMQDSSAGTEAQAASVGPKKSVLGYPEGYPRALKSINYSLPYILPW